MVEAGMTTTSTPIADRIKRLVGDKTPRQIKRMVQNHDPRLRRTRQRLNAEFGAALELRGAVKKSRLKKLEALAKDVPGYTPPKAAQEALNSYSVK